MPLGASAKTCAPCPALPARIASHGPAIWPPTASAGPSSRRWARPSTDHGHPTALTADLALTEAEALFRKVCAGAFTPQEAELFRAQMLTEMAAMSVDDGLVMQLHPGSFRNHNAEVFARFGRDKGADIPMRTDYVHALKPLLDRFGNEPRLQPDPLHAG